MQPQLFLQFQSGDEMISLHFDLIAWPGADELPCRSRLFAVLENTFGTRDRSQFGARAPQQHWHPHINLYRPPAHPPRD
jgi:hypothetical protein